MWGYVEADFRRDYDVRLCDELPHMSWREFKVLLNGLSPWGAVATHYDSEAKRVRLEDDDARPAPSAAITSFWQGVASIGRPE